VNVQQASPPSRAEVADTRRLINDGIASSAEQLDDEVMILFEFLCECGAASCDEVVHLTVAQYHVRRVGAVVAHPTL
jgi:hypothetical protein